MVEGRRPPSRWSCRSTFGARLACSWVTAGPALGSVRTALMQVILSLREGPLVRTFTDIDQLAAAVGEELGTSDWFEVEQAKVDLFADATDDHQWIHVDRERAAQGPFGGTIAHGYMTVSLIPALSRSIFTVETDGPRLNYGLNKVRFPNPVKVGSRVRASATLAELADVPAGKQLVVPYTIEIEGEDKPACVAETVALLLG